MDVQHAPAWAGAACGRSWGPGAGNSRAKLPSHKDCGFLGNVQPKRHCSPAVAWQKPQPKAVRSGFFSVDDPRETFSRAELSKILPVLLKKRTHTFTDTKIWESWAGSAVE